MSHHACYFPLQKDFSVFYNSFCEEIWYLWGCRALISLQLHKNCGIACMTGIMSWVATCLFRKDRPESWGSKVALYVKEHLECMELCLGVDDERVESLWVRMKGQANIGDTAVDVYYRPPDQEEEVAETFYVSSFTVTHPGSHGGLQPPWQLLERQHS